MCVIAFERRQLVPVWHGLLEHDFSPSVVEQ